MSVRKANILVIVESPLQLVNANEFVKRYKDEDVCVEMILLSSRGENNRLQMINCLKVLDFKVTLKEIQVDNIDASIFNRWQFYIKVIKAARSLKSKPYNQVLVGHITSIYQMIFAQAVIAKQYTFLDDGTSTFAEQEILKKKRIKSFSPWYKRCFPILFGLSANIPYIDGKLYFFTAYKDVIEKNHPYFSYTHNDVSYLKKEYQKKEIDRDIVFFIGTPFYWKEKDKDCTTAVFQRIGEYYGQKKVYYFPHRYEPQSNLQLVKNLGWELVEPKLPLEVNLISYPKLGSEFGLFTSSGFYTLRGLLPKAVGFNSFKFDQVGYLNNSRNILRIYDNYEQEERIKVTAI